MAKKIARLDTEAIMLATYLQAVAGEVEFFNSTYELNLFLEGRNTDEKVYVSVDQGNALNSIVETFDEVLFMKFNRHVTIENSSLYVTGLIA